MQCTAAETPKEKDKSYSIKTKSEQSATFKSEMHLSPPAGDQQQQLQGRQNSCDI